MIFNGTRKYNKAGLGSSFFCHRIIETYCIYLDIKVRYNVPIKWKRGRLVE
ncbi:hypothetical protein GCM10008934_16440 [Virgibacillus salarius]